MCLSIYALAVVDYGVFFFHLM
jgi:hypothetical protein